MNWEKVGDNYVEYNLGDVITISGGNIPIGIAMNDAKKGENVSVVLCGSGRIDSGTLLSLDTEEETETSPKEYEVPTINLEVPKIEC